MRNMASLPRFPLSSRRAGLFLSLGLGVATAACVAEKKSEPLAGNLLAGATVETGGVPHTDRLIDGKAAQEGDFWDTAITARFDNAEGHVTWDLGQPKPIQCVLVQGDNNDSYVVAGSLDGKEWKPLYDAAPVTGAGMRLRQGKVDGNARYVRLTANGGDRSYSVGEIAVYSSCPANWPKIEVPRAENVDPGASGSGGGVWTVSLALFAVALIVFIMLTRRRSDPPKIDLPPPDEHPLG
jgi:hypothetical protein